MGRIQRRLTSNDATIDFLPCSVEQEHQAVIDFQGADGGTFTLRVNGEETADITFDTSTTTLVGNINTALDALDLLQAGDLVASGTSIRAISIDAAANGWYRIELLNIDDLTGSGVESANIRVEQQGATTLRIQDVIMKFDYSIDIKDTEAAAIDEFEDFPQPVSSGMSFNLSMYYEDDNAINLPLSEEGLTGTFIIYPAGDAPGKSHFSFNAMINNNNTDYPFRDKIEIKIAGKRQGKFIDPFGTLNKV